jgi:signal transduction histidine kinase
MALLPRSLFGRLMLIWLVGMALVLGVSLALFVGERDRVGRAALFEGIAQEIAATAEAFDQFDAGERATRIAEFGRRRLRLSMEAPPADAEAMSAQHPFSRALRQAMPERDARAYLVQRGGPSRTEHRRFERGHDGRHASLLVTVRMSDGDLLSLQMPGIPPQPEFRTPEPGRLVASLAALLGGVLVLSLLAVRIATRPLSDLAEAARRLGEAPEHNPPLAIRGPAEVGHAAGAFNQMQERIREHIAERTRILAAISHDLQTPITRLRLRAEMLEDEALRGRFVGDLEAMQALIREGLDYARSRDDATPLEAVDIDSLLDALVEDAAEMGWRVAVRGRARRPCLARPAALRRALWNVIGNGVKFGGSVSIDVATHADQTALAIRDQGPGLPEDELEKVFEPFYRTEASRSRDTGGSGLGLAIARNLLRAQGGDIGLANHADGGLIARITLKCAPVAGSSAL